MNFHIHESIKKISPKCSLGYLVIRNIVVQGTPPSLAHEFFHLQVEAAKFYNIEELLDIPPIIGVRGIYKKVDFNPVRHNKTSEDIVRNIIQRKGAYYVNSAIAVNNYCAIKFLLPFGLYDLDQIDGEISYQLDTMGAHINIEDKNAPTTVKPLLSDAKGVFGNPYLEDAIRAKVTLATRNILLVVYADEEVNKEELNKILSFARDMILCYNGGTVEIQDILSV
jgi:DNA/RNA-binding domain of Phe-tRNA-synthetase-like protein